MAWSNKTPPTSPKLNDGLITTSKTSYFVVFQIVNSQGGPTGGITHAAKIYGTTLVGQFQRSSTRTTTRNHWHARSASGKRRTRRRGFFTGRETKQREKERTANVSPERKPFSLSTKSRGNNACWKGMETSWFWWTPRTRQPSMPYHFSLFAYTQISATK